MELGEYRYGFNGKENDNEVKGDGNSLDFGLRVYDPRVAKFLSVDPLTQEFPWSSTYSYAANDPINFDDVEGARPNPVRPAVRFSAARRAYLRNLSQSFSRNRSNSYVSGPINTGNPPSTAFNEGISRSIGGYYIETPNGGFYVADTKRKMEPIRYRTPQQADFDDGMAAGSAAYAALKGSLSSERVTNDPNNLTAAEIQESVSRLLQGNGTAQDNLFASYIAQRGSTKSRVGEILRNADASDYVKKNILTIAVADAVSFDGRVFRLIGINTSLVKDKKLMESLNAGLRPGEILVPGITEKGHAEENIYNYAKRWGLQVISIDPSRNFCLDCEELRRANASPTNTPSSKRKSKARR